MSVGMGKGAWVGTVAGLLGWLLGGTDFSRVKGYDDAARYAERRWALRHCVAFGFDLNLGRVICHAEA
jgi:hypothetical protein